MAINLDDIKDKISSAWTQSLEKFQESSLYNQAHDRFENLSPTSQKLTLIGTALFATFLIFSIPLSFYSSSSEHIAEFEAKRNTIRDLLKVTREAHDNPDIAVPPPIDNIKGMVENNLRGAQLMPEQIQSVEISSEKSNIVPTQLTQGMLKVSLAKLNLRQILDIGHQLQSMNASIKMKDMHIEANSQMPKYFDVVFKLVALNVPQEKILPPDPPENKKDSKKKSKSEKATEDE